MKTTLLFITLLTLIALIESEERQKVKKKRGSLESSYVLNGNHISFGGPVDLGTHELIPPESEWKGSHLPFQATDIYASGVDKYLPISNFNPVEYNLKINFAPQVASNFPIRPVSNSVEKPVEEPQEYVPPQSVSAAIIPQMPPPATPVNAAASNIPANRGAVFLGSGSLGVVSLGNGAYALGSGSIGYSGNRAQPRPAGNFPIYPPLQATPNLIPAAVPSPSPPPAPPGIINNFNQLPVNNNNNNVDYNRPVVNVPILNANGYEFLPPNRVGFGSPNPRPPRLKTTQLYATPTFPFQQNTPQLQNVQITLGGYPNDPNIPIPNFG